MDPAHHDWYSPIPIALGKGIGLWSSDAQRRNAYQVWPAPSPVGGDILAYLVYDPHLPMGRRQRGDVGQAQGLHGRHAASVAQPLAVGLHGWVDE